MELWFSFQVMSYDGPRHYHKVAFGSLERINDSIQSNFWLQFCVLIIYLKK